MVFSVLLVFPIEARADDLFRDGPSGTEFSQFPFWSQVLADMPVAAPATVSAIPAAARDDARQGQDCVDERRCTPAVWIAFLYTLRAKSRGEQIAAVNRWVNQRPYVEDMANWGVADYWATPGQFLSRGGDCEDYAITKYFSLVRLGFPIDDLRLVVVNDTDRHIFHAVLAVRSEGRAWLLDNESPEVTPFAAAARYKPIYSLNEHGWWMHSLPRIDLGAVTIVAAGSPNR